MSDFLHMGGYAFFVWTSFGISFAILVYNAIQPLIRHKQLKREISGQIKRQQSIKEHASKT